MKFLDKSQIRIIKDEIIKGNVFIYPTDTIYGVGCSALDSKAVLRIRNIKRSSKPFSVIAPSLSWIEENCFIDENVRKWLNKLPGPYTLILKLKNKKAISNEVNNNSDTIGIRMPDNWFFELIKELNIPFITTSVNITGSPYMKKIGDIEIEIKEKVDFIIDTGELNGKPSTIIDLSSGDEKIIRN